MSPSQGPGEGGLTVSVVICAHTIDRWADLRGACASALGQTLPPLELIVVVDHEPQLYERVRRELPGVRAVQNSGPRGLSGARNSGVKRARGQVVAFLDDDAMAAPDWLERTVPAYADPAVVGTGGAVWPRWPADRPRWLAPEFDWVVGCSYVGLPEEPATIRNPIGANMSFRRDVVIADGGFRTGIGRVGANGVGCEETELSIRICQQRPGTRIVHLPGAEVRHRVTAARTRPRYFASRCWAEGRSKALVASAVGTAEGLASERAHVTRLLTRGLARELGSGADGRLAGLARAASIVAGLAMTAAGYAWGRVSARAQRPGHHGVVQGDDPPGTAAGAPAGERRDGDKGLQAVPGGIPEEHDGPDAQGTAGELDGVGVPLVAGHTQTGRGRRSISAEGTPGAAGSNTRWP